MFEENLILSAFRSSPLQQRHPQKAWSRLLHKLAYHVVPDSPLMYVTQSRRFNFFSPMRLPYSPVIDFSPPPVVMIATTGTCWAEEDGTFTSTAFNIASQTAMGSSHHTQPRSWSKSSGPFSEGKAPKPSNDCYCCFSLWINMGSEINPNLGSCPSLGQIGAQMMNKKKPFCGGNNVFSLYVLLLCHFFLISHIYYYCMKIHIPTPWRNTPSSQPVLLSYAHQCCYASVSWSYFEVNCIYFKEFQNCKKGKIL